MVYANTKTTNNKKPPMWIFFDDVIREYINHYGENAEKYMIKHLKKYLCDFSKTSKIMIITNQNVTEKINWFFQNDLYKFIDNISNPFIKS